MSFKRFIISLRKGVDTNYAMSNNNFKMLLNKYGVKNYTVLFEKLGTFDSSKRKKYRNLKDFIINRKIVLEFPLTVDLNDLLKHVKKFNHIIEFIEEDQQINFIEPVDINYEKRSSNSNSGYPLETIGYKNSTIEIKGDGVIVGILDSGINYNHHYLKKSLWYNLNNGSSCGINYTNKLLPHRYDVMDYNGHGTHISGIIGANSNKKVIGIAGKAKLLALKINPSTYETYVSNICEALVDAYRLGALVLNNSWYVNIRGKESKTLNQTLKNLIKNNCIPVFAAGNSKININAVYPQNKKEYITVGAIANDLSRAYYSNWGDNITIWAPGNKIKSTYIGKGENSLQSLTGTSVAAPFVTGTIALLKQQNKGLSIKNIKQILRESGNTIEIKNNKSKSYLLNINESLKRDNNINFKNREKMKENKLITRKRIPETPEDVNEFIFTFLHLERSNIFQLLHNETDKKGNNKFQVYGKFKGEKIVTSNGTEKFLLEKVDLKLVNMVQVKGVDQYTISNADIVYDDKNEIKFNIFIDKVKKQKRGIDLTLKKLFVIEKFIMIDYHVDTVPPLQTRNGRPCNTMAFF